MERIRKDFGVVTWAMIPVAIAINIAVGTLIYNVKVPLYLDSIGTVFVGVLAGPWAGALTGLLSNLIWGLTGLNPQYTPFAPVAAVIGMLAAFFGEAGWMRAWWKVILAGLITGFIASVISAPISAYVFGGVTGSGTDLVVAFFRGMGLGILPASFAQGVSSDPLDKTVTYLVVWLILMGLPKRFLARFPRAENVQGMGAATPLMPPSAMPGAAMASGMPARAETQAPAASGAMPATKTPPTKRSATRTSSQKKPTAAAKRPASGASRPKAPPRPKAPARKTTRR